MSTSKRKIGFYSLRILNPKKDGKEVKPIILKHLIDAILKLNKLERILDVKRSNKFHLLTFHSNKYNFHNIIFSSAKYYHRPPLIDKDTAGLRDNPKQLSEGELEHTHISLKYSSDEIILLLEERSVGISIGKIVFYFNQYFRKILNDEHNTYVIDYSIIPKGNFLQELDKLKRVRFGQIYTDKLILGSEFLNFAKRTETVQENVQIIIKAKRGHSIKETIKIIARKFYAENEKISKIRIYGNSKEGNQVLLDTDIVKMIEYIDVDPDSSTGIVNSDEIFISLNSILKEMVL